MRLRFVNMLEDLLEIGLRVLEVGWRLWYVAFFPFILPLVFPFHSSHP